MPSSGLSYRRLGNGRLQPRCGWCPEWFPNSFAPDDVRAMHQACAEHRRWHDAQRACLTRADSPFGRRVQQKVVRTAFRPGRSCFAIPRPGPTALRSDRPRPDG